MFQGSEGGDAPSRQIPTMELEHQDEHSLIVFETNEYNEVLHEEGGTNSTGGNVSGLSSVPKKTAKKQKRGNKKQNLNAFPRNNDGEEEYEDEDVNSTYHYKNHTFVASRGLSSVKSRSNHYYNHHHHHHQHKYHYYTRPKTKEEYVLAK